MQAADWSRYSPSFDQEMVAGPETLSVERWKTCLLVCLPVCLPVYFHVYFRRQIA
jgi:hypothetical protein